MSLEIVLQKEASEGDWKFLLNKLSYSFQCPLGILMNGRIAFQNGDYIFKLNKSSKNSTDTDCTHQNVLR